MMASTNSDYFPVHHLMVFVFGAFAELRKATISFLMSVCHSVSPSVHLPAHVEQPFPHWKDFHEI
jgi:hypothetical protein